LIFFNHGGLNLMFLTSNYNWKITAEHVHGFIAQNIQDALFEKTESHNKTTISNVVFRILSFLTRIFHNLYYAVGSFFNQMCRRRKEWEEIFDQYAENVEKINAYIGDEEKFPPECLFELRKNCSSLARVRRWSQHVQRDFDKKIDDIQNEQKEQCASEWRMRMKLWGTAAIEEKEKWLWDSNMRGELLDAISAIQEEKRRSLERLYKEASLIPFMTPMIKKNNQEIEKCQRQINKTNKELKRTLQSSDKFQNCCRVIEKLTEKIKDLDDKIVVIKQGMIQGHVLQCKQKLNHLMQCENDIIRAHYSECGNVGKKMKRMRKKEMKRMRKKEKFMARNLCNFLISREYIMWRMKVHRERALDSLCILHQKLLQDLHCFYGEKFLYN